MRSAHVDDENGVRLCVHSASLGGVRFAAGRQRAGWELAATWICRRIRLLAGSPDPAVNT